MARVVGHSDDEVEDDVLGQKVEEVVPVHQTLEALFDDAEEGVQGTKVFDVFDQWRSAALAICLRVVAGTPWRYTSSVAAETSLSLFPPRCGTPEPVI
jgi:hypothetical protein